MDGRQQPTGEAGGRWRHAPDHGWMQARSNVIYASENCEDFHISVERKGLLGQNWATHLANFFHR
jgi:hypothetical protein